MQVTRIYRIFSLLSISKLVSFRVMSEPTNEFIDHQIVKLESGGETKTIIWLHGLGDTPNGWLDVAKMMKKKLPQFKWILPQALTQPVTCNQGYKSTSWFDLSEIPISTKSPDLVNGQKESIAFIRHLIDRELTNGRKSQDIVIGGFSQGAALSLLSVIKFNDSSSQSSSTSSTVCAESDIKDSSSSSLSLGGLIMLSGWLVKNEKINFNSNHFHDTQVFIGHGSQDNVVLKECADEVINLLSPDTKDRTTEINLTSKFYLMGHSSCNQEMSDLFDFLNTF